MTTKTLPPCTCDAYPFPHRIGGGECQQNLICYHGRPTEGHYDYEGRCPECDAEEDADNRRDE